MLKKIHQSEILRYKQKTSKTKKKKFKQNNIVQRKKSTKILLSSLCVGNPLLGMALHLGVICKPKDTPFEKLNFYLHAIINWKAFYLGMGSCVHSHFAPDTSGLKACRLHACCHSLFPFTKPLICSIR